jgi:hypothetical protein
LRPSSPKARSSGLDACAGLVKRARRHHVPYGRRSRQGFIEATPGNVVDYGAIEQRILAYAALFQVREIAYDP